ncbi:MAG: DUF4922 domain-containing protein [Deltaproteobacteria bacterium]|nr:DUF4922 domain-containing protein [Deltaproteobacteria bacterium]
MSWEAVILSAVRTGDALAADIDSLFEQQRRSWPALREAESTLATLARRELSLDGARIVVQANPGRRTSVQARVDPESIASRPCFLCPEHMPPEERGIAFGPLVILPNPHPILGRHCTVPARDHSPQRIAGRIGLLLELARALGPEMLALYNGPRCGASAPDHFHFQSCEATAIPLLAELGAGGVATGVRARESFGRRLLAIEDRDAGEVEARIRHALDVLAGLTPDEDEPMLNILARFADARYQVVLFPRSRHRPSVFFASGRAHIAVSPAALEMAGLLVVAEPEHLERVDANSALAIYEEVSLDEARFNRLAEEMT